MSKPLRIALLVALLAACADREDAAAPLGAPTGGSLPAPAAPPAARTSSADYAAAVAAPGRLAEDREQDAQRKPAELLAGFGVQPGMTVLDLYSGAGYFTELLSHVVGPTGRVVAHNNTPYLDGTQAQWAARMADPQRLANVERLTAENNELELEPNQFDFVLLSAVYHDVYFVNEAIGWSAVDGPKLLAELFAAMKPGATLGLIDHAAPAGSPAETGGTLHRIDPAVVERDFAAAGFVLIARSDLLRNPADDFSKGVFDPAVRGRTDRFVLLFRRP
jgi:predicted methyltransferase